MKEQNNKNKQITSEDNAENNNVTLVYPDEICVCCGHPAMPDSMLCKKCTDETNKE